MELANEINFDSPTTHFLRSSSRDYQGTVNVYPDGGNGGSLI